MISKEEICDNLICVTVSDAGAHHRILCVPNQDAAFFDVKDEDFVIAVSDGVGSCKEAGRGSKYAVDACRLVFENIKACKLPFDNSEILKTIISEWKSQIGTENTDDFCATLKAIFKIGRVMKLVSLGDGIVAATSNGISIMAPFVETAFTNETKCLCSHTFPGDFWVNDFVVDIYEPFVAFCCTDGAANGFVAGKELNLINELEKSTSKDTLKRELEDLIKEIGKYIFDDKTIGVVKYEKNN